MEDKANTGSIAVESAESTVTPTKKAVKSKAKAQRIKSSHPPISEMVNAAIKELKDRKGSSLQAIKKYIATTYKIDSEKLAPFIKRYLKSSVTSGTVVQTKGKGASGSFKLSTGGKSEPKVKKVQQRVTRKIEAKKTQSVEKKTVVKKPAAKKPTSPKKAAIVEKKVAAPKKTAKPPTATKTKAAAEAKSISKTKKTAKAPAAKTKTPKPKKAAAPKTKAPAKK